MGLTFIESVGPQTGETQLHVQLGLTDKGGGIIQANGLVSSYNGLVKR